VARLARIEALLEQQVSGGGSSSTAT